MTYMADLSDLIESIDILEYISQFADFTEKNGEYWALSPLKCENTPSFSIRKETNSFYDFSSGIGGNVFTFVKHYFKCSNSEAIKRLCDYAHIDNNIKPKSKLEATKIAKKFKKIQSIKNKYNEKNQPVLSDDYMERFDDKSDKLGVWENEGISKNSLNRFDVRYDSFSNRLVFPIKNTDGKIVNVSGRTIDSQWKEKGVRKYTYFKPWNDKSKSEKYGTNVIYGLYENKESILKKREIILFEGCKSVLLADTYGVCNTGAILTSHLNPMQVKILINLGVRVVFALDKDVCVTDDHNIKKLKQFVRVEYICDKHNLLKDKDSPIDNGFETFKQLYDERRVWL